MILNIVLLLLGLALVVFGADWLVDGASSVARKAGVSEFVIGVTIVGFGTSCPELVVSLTGAIQGNADVSLGNVVGSNIFNTLLILGLTALLVPVSMTRDNARRDIPMTIIVTLLFVICGFKNSLLGLGEPDVLGRTEGIVFLVVFIAYLVYCFKSDSGADEALVPNEKNPGLPVSIGLIAAGLAGLVFGGRLFVDNAVGIAHSLGLSDKFIAVTLLAGGTSLPELATCVVAAAKKKDQLALGNILGSNVFNILLILGCSAVVTPLNMGSINIVDVAVLLLSVVLLLLFAYTGKRNRIDRPEGVVFLLMEAAYMVWLFIKG